MPWNPPSARPTMVAQSQPSTMVEVIFFTGNAECMADPTLFRDALEKATEATRHVRILFVCELTLLSVIQTQRSRATILGYRNRGPGLAYLDSR